MRGILVTTLRDKPRRNAVAASTAPLAPCNVVVVGRCVAARVRVHLRLNVASTCICPRSATYVTNVRYSLGESRVCYVKSAVTLRV